MNLAALFLLGSAPCGLNAIDILSTVEARAVLSAHPFAGCIKKPATRRFVVQFVQLVRKESACHTPTVIRTAGGVYTGGDFKLSAASDVHPGSLAQMLPVLLLSYT